jgi:hypothetical protein
MNAHLRRRYLVLARREYVESLTYQGMLDAGAGEDPGALARERFGSDWLELALAPERAVYWVVEPATGREATA